MPPWAAVPYNPWAAGPPAGATTNPNMPASQADPFGPNPYFGAGYNAGPINSSVNQELYKQLGYQGYAPGAAPGTSVAPIDTGETGQDRIAMLALAQDAAARAQGAGPSVGVGAGEQSFSDAIQAQASRAARARPGLPPGVGVTAGAPGAVGDLTNAAGIRGAEQAAASGAQGDIIHGVRGADLGLASANVDISKFNMSTAEGQYQYLQALQQDQQNKENEVRMALWKQNTSQGNKVLGDVLSGASALGGTLATIATAGAAAPWSIPLASAGVSEGQKIAGQENGGITLRGPRKVRVGEKNKPEAIVVLGKNKDGTHRVRGRNGVEVDVHPSGLPPGLCYGGMVHAEDGTIVGESAKDSRPPPPGGRKGAEARDLMRRFGYVTQAEREQTPGSPDFVPHMAAGGIALPPGGAGPGADWSQFSPNPALPPTAATPTPAAAPMPIPAPAAPMTDADIAALGMDPSKLTDADRAALQAAAGPQAAPGAGGASGSIPGQVAALGAGATPEPGTSGSLTGTPPKPTGGPKAPLAGPDKAEADAIAEAKAGAKGTLETETEKGKAEAEVLGNVAADTEQYRAEQANAVQRAQEYQQEQEARFTKVQQDILNTRIDPNHLWANMGTGSQILAGLGMLFGTIGGGLTGKNAALDVLDKAIDRDVDAQKANFENKRAGFEAMRSIYGMHMAALGDQRAALAAAHETALEMAKQQLQQVAANARGPEAAAAYQTGLSAIDAGLAKYRMERMAAGQDAALKGIQIQEGQRNLRLMNAADQGWATLRGGSALTNLPGDQQSAVVQQAAQSKRLVPGRGVTDVEVPPDKQNQYQMHDQAVLMLKNIDNLVHAPYSFDNVHKAQAIAKSLKMVYMPALGVSARPGEPLADALDEVISNSPASWHQAGPWAQHWEARSAGAKTALHDAVKGLDSSLGMHHFGAAD